MGLFGIRLLILHFKFQISKSIKSSTFHIFLNLISFPKCPKITQRFTQNRQTVVNELERFSFRLKRDRDIGRKRPQNSLHVYPRLNVCIFTIAIQAPPRKICVKP